MHGKTHENIKTIHPKDGVIAILIHLQTNLVTY